MRRVSVCGKGAWIWGGALGSVNLSGCWDPARYTRAAVCGEDRWAQTAPRLPPGSASRRGDGPGSQCECEGLWEQAHPPGRWRRAPPCTAPGSRAPRLSRTPHLPASRHCGGGAGRGRRSWRATAVGHVRPPLVSVSEALSGRARPLLPCGPWLLSCVQGGLCCRGGDHVALRPGQLLPGPSRRTPPGRADAQIHLGWRSVCRADDDAL